MTGEAAQPVKRMCVSARTNLTQSINITHWVATTVVYVRGRERIKDNTKWHDIVEQNRQNVSGNEQEWTSMCLKWSNAVIALPLCSVANGDNMKTKSIKKTKKILNTSRLLLSCKQNNTRRYIYIDIYSIERDNRRHCPTIYSTCPLF